jgi:Uma2 family endonuclease
MLPRDPAETTMPPTASARAKNPRSAEPRVRFATVADLLDRLCVPAERVCMDPPPGRATKQDLVRLDGKGKLYELVDRTLVEKPMGSPEAYLAMELGWFLRNYVENHDTGFLAGADALIEILPNLVRGPDVSFVPWTRQPERTVPLDPISALIPTLAVEILSPSNTRKEMARKLDEYFRAGVLLVWIIDPVKRTAEVYTGPDAKAAVDALDGGDVLPGFRLPLAKLFEKLAKPAPSKKPRKKK